MITEEQVKQYHQEGYTIVENVFGDNELDPVLNEFEEIVNDLAERAFLHQKIKNKYENENVLAFRDINPQAPTHFLVIPKKEISTLNDIVESDKELIGELFIVAKELAEKEGIAESGYRTVFNCNDHGCQTVNHIHLHVIGGRQMKWPPG